MKRAATSLVLLAVLTATLPAADPAKPLDLKALPANQWTEQPTSGWKGKTNYGPVLQYGLCQAGEFGIAVWDASDQPGTVRIRKFDLASGAWTELAAEPLVPLYKEFSSGTPSDGNLHGMQLCYDSDRKALVGLTSTDLNGQSRTVELELPSKKAAGVKPDPSPPTVTAASLCYDPINKEAVLATGGFSPVGGTDGTWLYDGAKKTWRRLPAPREVEEVRQPLEKARDRLVALRWLTWKNLEFRVTGRDQLLDERARAETLAQEGALLAGEFKLLSQAAKRNAGKAERKYHQERLTAAAALLEGAASQLAGVEGKLRSGTPEELETLYRGQLVPLQETCEQALAELAVTPEPRMSARLVYDSKNQVIVCFGGDGQRCAWGDTWVYHCAGRWWERRQPKTHPAPSSARAITFDARSGLVVFVSPQRLPSSVANYQLWTYDAGKNEWRQRRVGAPADTFWLEHDTQSGCLVAFNHGLNKAWLLRPDLETIGTVDAKEARAIAFVPVDGQYVLRDAATVADLKKWQTETDQWNQGVPANTWTPVPTHGTGRPNWGRTWSSHVFDPDRRQLYYRDGGHGSYHGADTDHYDLPTGRWFRSDRRDLPPWPMGTYFGWGRSFSNAPWAIHNYKYNLWYNPLRKRLQREIGQSGVLEGATPNTVLEYDPDTGLWARELVTMPGAIHGMVGGPVVPGMPAGLACVRNFSRYGTANGEGWLQTAQGVTQWKNLGMLPRTWDDHSWCWFFDPKRQRIHYYGGPKGKHQLFTLDISAAAPKWVEVAVHGAQAGQLPLSSREVVYLPRYDIFLMTSALGNQQQAPLEDLIWSFEPATGVFRQLKLPLGRGVTLKQGGAVSDGLQYDPVGNLCYFTQVSGSVPQMLAFRFVPENKSK